MKKQNEISDGEKYKTARVMLLEKPILTVLTPYKYSN